jgi:hypothetical protein
VKSRLPFILVGLAMLSACAPKALPPPVVDIASMTCTDAVVLQGAAPLLFDPKGKDEKTTPVILDGKSSCHQEDGGARRLYQVFALPEFGAPYIISVRTSPWADTILAPRVLLLDGSGRVLRSTTHADFVFRGEQLSALLRSHPEEAYLALTSDSDVLGKQITRIIESTHSTAAFMPPSGAFIWYSGSDSTNRMVLSVAGRAEITVTPFPAPDGKK